MPSRFGLLLALFTLSLAGTGFSEDKDPIHIPTETAPPPIAPSPLEKADIKPLHSVHLDFVTTSGHPATVRLKLYKSDGTPVFGHDEWFTANRFVNLRLEKGKYHLMVSAGPRYIIWQGILRVKNQDLTAGVVLKRIYDMLSPEQKSELDNWILIDTYTATDKKFFPSSPGLDVFVERGQATGVQASAIQDMILLRDSLGTPFLEDNSGQMLPFEIENARKAGLLLLDCDSDFLQRIVRIYPQPRMSEKSEFSKKRLNSILSSAVPPGSCTIWSAGEADAGIIFATVAGPLYDAVDITACAHNLRLWLFLLSMGYRPAAVGGGPWDTTEKQGFTGAGCWLRYPYTKELRAGELLDYIKKGRTVASNGPLLSVTINGIGPGGNVVASSTPARLKITAQTSGIPGDSPRYFEIYYNGRVIKRDKTEDNNSQWFESELDAPFDEEGWVSVSYVSRDEKHLAISNPIFITGSKSGTPVPSPARAQILVRFTRRGMGEACTANIWDRGIFIGQTRIGPEGGKLVVPPTAELSFFDQSGHELGTYTAYEACDIAKYEKKISANPRRLQSLLLERKTYDNVRELLKNGHIDLLAN